jgi:hypothetical protein
VIEDDIDLRFGYGLVRVDDLYRKAVGGVRRYTYPLRVYKWKGRVGRRKELTKGKSILVSERL